MVKYGSLLYSLKVVTEDSQRILKHHRKKGKTLSWSKVPKRVKIITHVGGQLTSPCVGQSVIFTLGTGSLGTFYGGDILPFFQGSPNATVHRETLTQLNSKHVYGFRRILF